MNALKLGLVMLFHPLYGIDIIKRRTAEFSRWPSLFLILAAVAARLFTAFCQNYTVSGIEIDDINILLDVLLIIVPIVTWILVNYFMTEIMSGETKLGEIVSYTAYALLPYIISAPVFVLASWVMSEGLMPFYNLAQIFIFAWVGLLLFLGLMRANDYGFWKAVLVAVVLVIFMLLVWALLLLFFALVSQTWMTVNEFVTEIRIRGVTG